MPKKLKICDKPECSNTTHGKMCTTHSRENRRKFNNVWETKRDHSLRKKYGITLNDFNKLWEECGGKCAICENEMKPTEMRRGQSLEVVAVDHDHQTGKVRGLLCNACNKGLGLFNDSIEKLDKAKRYLQNDTKISDDS